LKTQLFEIKNYGCYKFLKKTLIWNNNTLTSCVQKIKTFQQRKFN
jgi:hypothetical protein